MRVTVLIVAGAVVAALVAAPVAPATAAGSSATPFSALQLARRLDAGRQAAMEARGRDERAAFREHSGSRSTGPARRSPTDGFGTITNVMEISRDTLPRHYVTAGKLAEPNTQIEPDVAMDPANPDIVTAVFQQGRFPDGGSEDPGWATSLDGGSTWSKGDLPGLTMAVGGPFERASDPVVAFGVDGRVFAQTLAFDQSACHSAISVQWSNDHGQTFGGPQFPQDDPKCSVFNDKNWIAADTSEGSPYRGRVYMAWDRIHIVDNGTYTEPIVLRYSDDGGTTWSRLINVSSDVEGIGVIPLIEPNGHLAVVYDAFDPITRTDYEVSQRSTDGGRSWSYPPVVIAQMLGTGSQNLRTGGLPAAAVDPATNVMYAAWQDTRFRADGLNDIVISRSDDEGQTWTKPERVNQDALDSGLNHFTPAVAAAGGFVHVTYNVRYEGARPPSPFVDEGYTVSADGGLTFGPEHLLGSPADLRYAATVFGRRAFLGDYQGLAATPTIAHAVWCRSSFNADQPKQRHHQTAWGATILR